MKDEEITIGGHRGGRVGTRNPYHFEIPLPDGGKCVGNGMETIELCVAECKRKCAELGVNYDDREVKLFLTDGDGTEECTEEGEFAG